MTRLTLTFDNGPTPGVTDQVLDILANRGLKATFFVIGEKLLLPERRELAERARAEGHWIGNHTMTHGEPLGLIHDSSRERGEIEEAQSVLGDLGEPRRLYRPTGHGSIGKHLLSPAAADILVSGGYTMILWSLFVRDSKMPVAWEDRALTRLSERDWQVLVVHDLPTGAIDALPRFLDTADSSGVEYVQDFPPDCVPIVGGRPSDDFYDLYVADHRILPDADGGS